jgi:hypothetical protein
VQEAIEAEVQNAFHGEGHSFLGEENVAPGAEASAAALKAITEGSDDYIWVCARLLSSSLRRNSGVQHCVRSVAGVVSARALLPCLHALCFTDAFIGVQRLRTRRL